ncbi:MAG: NUDIX hydrolase [Promethearchaeota archaeon]
MVNKIVPCVGAVILDAKNRVLLVKHVPEKGGFWQGKYICPGGRLEFGESLEIGVQREVREETGLEIEILRWVRPMERLIFNAAGTLEEHILYLDVIARVRQGQFRPASDVGEGDWFSKDQLPRILTELHEDTQQLLEEAGLL